MPTLSEKNKDFFQDVYAVVRLIPRGRVTSYGAIAKYLSSPKASRMVGWAMNNAHSLPDVPAHRVVNRNGLLTGKMHFSTPNTMEMLLQNEGVKVKEDKILDFDEKFWDPTNELTL
jgi:methylated-DNA-protein-cysteine methyltransferase-like protein